MVYAPFRAAIVIDYILCRVPEKYPRFRTAPFCKSVEEDYCHD